MLTEFHCPRGHRRAIEPRALKAKVRCHSCGQTVSFRQRGEGPGETRWLVVGGSDGPPRLAVPIPMGETLKVGSGSDCWLALPGDDVAGVHAELTLREEDRQLAVRHVGGASGSWIDAAKVLTGVLHEGEEVLRIGAYQIALCSQALLPSVEGADIPEVVIEEDDEGAKPDEAEEAEEFRRPYVASELTLGQSIRRVACVLVIVVVGAYITRSVLFPGVPPEMPKETEFRCPADGTVFRAGWSSTPPKCPSCGQYCYGSMGKTVKLRADTGGQAAGDAAERQPTTSAATTTSAPTAKDAESGRRAGTRRDRSGHGEGETP